MIRAAGCTSNDPSEPPLPMSESSPPLTYANSSAKLPTQGVISPIPRELCAISDSGSNGSQYHGLTAGANVTITANQRTNAVVVSI